jgi:D-threo-aldose 1-dehydrogenase
MAMPTRPERAAAVQFPLGHPAVASVDTGVGSAAHAEEVIRLFGQSVPDALWQDLLGAGSLTEATPTPSQAEARPS